MTTLLTIAVLLYWFTMGATEGFKWTQTPKMVTARNYHVFRALSTFGVLLQGFACAGLVSLGMPWFQFVLVFLANHLIFWPIYELTLNWVNWGTLFPDKGIFVLGPVKFRHPPARLIPLVSLVGIILLGVSMSFRFA
jgi:hypothetical protein